MKVPTAQKPLEWINIEGDLPLQAFEVLYDEGKSEFIKLLDEIDRFAPGYSDFKYKNLQFSIRIEDAENPKFYLIIEPEAGGFYRIIRFDGKKSPKLKLNPCLRALTKIFGARRRSRSNIANMPVNESEYNIRIKGPSDITNIFKLLAWIEDCGVKNISSTIEVRCDGTRVKWTVANNKQSCNAKTCEEIEL